MSAKHYLVCGHTAKGYINLISSNLTLLRKIFILTVGSGTGELVLLRTIASRLEALEVEVEYLHSPSDPEALDGVLFPGLGVGIVVEATYNLMEPTEPGTLEKYINFSDAWNSFSLAAQEEHILDLTNHMKRSYDNAYAAFANGLRVHDEWEKVYIQNMDFIKADQLTAEVIPILLGRIRFDKASGIKHRFFGGSTPYGPKDYVDNITEAISIRYFIKGRPGSGKSTMLKKILSSAKERGINVEVYHCGFDPDSLDMLLFPELSLCIFDSTAPHEYYPSREGDIIIDMYTELIKAGTDECYAEELADILSRYKAYTNEGTSHLASALVYRRNLDQLYDNATDFDVVNRIGDELYQEIIKFR